MTLNKQLINLAGILAVLVIVVAGVVLAAVPMISQASATDSQTQTVAQSNAVYEAQVTQLTTAQQGIADIGANLTDLRTEIAAQPKLDDVLEIVDKAVAQTGATVESIAVADPVSFVPRGAVVDTTGTGVPVAAPTPAPAATSGESGGDTAPSDAATTEPAPAAPADGAAVTPQAQVLITVTVTIADAKTAATFLDALRVGPRRILPIDAKLDDGKLTVQALTFIRTDDTTAPSTTEVAP